MAVDNKKEQERAELHKTIWSIADDLRGSVDGWDFKAYVLGFLFYRYISENFENYVNKIEVDSGNKSFKYSQMDDNDALVAKPELVKSKGFFILPSELFCKVKRKAQMMKI